MASALEPIRAMIATAKSDTGVTARVSNRIYFGIAPANVVMPYIVLYAVAPDGPVRTFASSADFQDTIYQWSIFDDDPSLMSATSVEKIASDLDVAFDRVTLTTYSDASAIGCIREGGGFGPVWDGEVWQRSIDYRVIYKF